MAKQTLDLDSFADRPTVIIRKKEYRLYTTDLLPVVENYEAKKLLERHDLLAAKNDLTNAEKTEIKKILDKVTRIVLDAPDAVHKTLTDRNRVEIIQCFQMPSLALWLERLAAASGLPVTESSTGATSSPASAASIPEPAAPSSS